MVPPPLASHVAQSAGTNVTADEGLLNGYVFPASVAYEVVDKVAQALRLSVGVTDGLTHRWGCWDAQ